MTTHSEIISVTYDDPNYYFYKKILTEENGWISDTCATSYISRSSTYRCFDSNTITKTMWYELEKQNESSLSN